VYELFGNQGAPSGDSGGILVWNHNSNHGGKGLIRFDSGWLSDAALSGAYTATLSLFGFNAVGSGGFVGAAPGDADADNPYTPGIATVKTDVFVQPNAWSEGSATTVWGNIPGTSSQSVTLTQSTATGWFNLDVTSLVASILSTGGANNGFALSQEFYGVLRADNGSIAVASFCDSESTNAACSAGAYSPKLAIASIAPVPLPPSVFLLSSALAGFAVIRRRKNRTA
jgi:hypothetical protein